MKLLVAKTEAQYRTYLAKLEELVALDPEPNSPMGDELDLLSLIVGDYEQREFHFAKPDPIEAIQFRMMEQDLRQVDLVPYIGSRSRVSEILSRQRPLTISMIRSLSKGLGIPSDVLLQEPIPHDTQQVDSNASEPDWSRFPLAEIVKRGWIQGVGKKSDFEKSVEALKAFIHNALGGARPGVLARRTIKGDAFSLPAQYALTAWQARVLQKANLPENRAKVEFKFERLNEEFFKRLVALSPAEDGPLLAVEYLREAGIAVVLEEHLSKTKLDGAAMLSGAGHPVIGLTLRFDRIDNFWFTLLHECMHIWKHLSNPGDVFLDRLMDKQATELVEKEANRLARDLLISRSHWKAASVRLFPTKSAIIEFATKHGLHPAIVAGRIQRETENYSVFADMVGQGAVRRLFHMSS